MNGKFTDIFIRRPVLAIVISLLIFIIGLRAIFDLPVRQFPKVENAMITVTTAYPGANAKLMEGFITTPLEKSMASAAGVNYMTSESMDNVSTIKAYIKLNFNPNVAFTNIMSKVAEVKNQLPKEAQDPVVQMKTGRSTAMMYIAFNSSMMTPQQITDYVSRVVQPKLETVDGVSEAEMLGPNIFAMRIWLRPEKMAAYGVSPNDVIQALKQNNFQAAAGKTKGKYTAITINASTDANSLSTFKEIIIKHDRHALVRLKNVAKVELGSENYDSSVVFNGEKALFIGIKVTPTANPLSVIKSVKNVLPSIESTFPPSLHAKVVYDATKYISASIYEVLQTILEATLIVILLIYFFLGSLRTVIVPVVTIPLSLIGVFGCMMALGYSINLLTLLSLVLAIGLVVDDAIVVVENCYRHIEGGLTPLEAATRGAREIATPIIAMTLTLAAVYAPIGLMQGLTGALFKEFAFTLASAVILSGIIALTLSPMMCSRLLNAELGQGQLVRFIDQRFHQLRAFYERRLHAVLAYRSLVVLFSFVVLLSCFFLFITSKSEMAPSEDQGVLFVAGTGPESANLDYMEKFTHAFNKIYASVPGLEDYFIVNGFGRVNSIISGFIMKPWNERHESQAAANAILQTKLNQVAGLQVQAFPLPPLPVAGGGLPVQFVLTTTRPYSDLYPVMQAILQKARKSGEFMYIVGSLRFNKPEVNLEINRSKAAQMGITMQSIATALAGSLGGNYINHFNLYGRSYEVIPQLQRLYRENPQGLYQIYLKTLNQKMIPLSSIVSMTSHVAPNALSHFQQLNSATISGLMAPGYTLSQGLNFLQQEANHSMSSGMMYDYSGQSRQFMHEGSAMLYTFLFSIIVIFLVLAAQFESFRDPLVILTSVPMAICGALLPISWGLATINVYTEIGLITLIGLISKHGILMLDFANKLRTEEPSMSRHDAITQAAAIRLRPVLMTTAAMILGVVPLLIATGAGAHSRFDIGLVVSSGMLIGTLFTLFVVPTMYTLKTKHILSLILSVFAISFGIYFLF